MRTHVRHRGLLVLLVLMLIGGGIPIAHQGAVAQDGGPSFNGGAAGGTLTSTAPIDAVSPAFVELGEPQGAIGQLVFPPDTAEEGGGECGTNRDVSPALIDILIALPQVSAAGETSQTVAFWLELWQIFPDNSVDFVGYTGQYFVPVNPGELTDPVSYTAWDLPVGPAWLPVLGIAWYDDVNAAPTGWTYYQVENYENWIMRGGAWEFVGTYNACYPLVDPVASLSPTSGTVNTRVNFLLYYFPLEMPFTATWDGKVLSPSTTTTDIDGRTEGWFKVPDGQVKGNHTVTFSVADEWVATRIYTVKPRIKVIPGTVERGQEVKISLRGYNARETVRIRWRDGEGVWREIARVTTSSTGSAQVYLPVPLFAPDGANSVRGDAVLTGGARAQTNAVIVTGGAFEPASARAEATPTVTPTVTPDGSPSPEPTTSETATATVEPTVVPTIEPTTEPTVEPTIEPTVEPTIEPTVEPTVEPTIEPTTEPVTETPVSD